MARVVGKTDGKRQAQFAADEKNACPEKIAAAELPQIRQSENSQEQQSGKAVHHRRAADRTHVQAQGAYQSDDGTPKGYGKQSYGCGLIGGKCVLEQTVHDVLCWNLFYCVIF